MAKKGLNEKIEAALDIADKMKNFDSSGTTSSGDSIKDEEIRRRAEEKKEGVARIQADIEKRKDTCDEQFMKDTFRRLAEIGVSTLEVLNAELQYDPTGRSVECMAAMTNSVVNSLNGIKDLENDKIKLGFEKEKIEIKKASAVAPGLNGPNGNILVVGKMQDVLKAIQDQKFSNMKEVEKIVDREVTEENAPGTVYKKDK